MAPYTLNGTKRTDTSRAQVHRPRIWLAATAVTVLAMFSVLAGGVRGAVADEGEPAPAATAITAIGSITSPVDGVFVPRNNVTVTGEKAVGSSVAVNITGGGGHPVAVGCASAPDQLPLATWSCAVTLPNGPNVTITATETDNTGATSLDTVTVNVLGPPTITTPDLPQTSPGTVSGTGFNGALISLHVNGGAPQDCHAAVTDGTWVCTIANGAGSYSITATQSFPPGSGTTGTSVASNMVTVEVRPVDPPDPTPTPTPVDPIPVPIPPPPTQPEPAPSPEPSEIETPEQPERTDSATLPWLDRPIFPASDGGSTTVREALTNWGTPSGFGDHLPTLSQTVTSSSWLWAPLMALLFIGLIALPLRLLVTTLRGRFANRRMKLTGRNRTTTPDDEPAPRNPWLMGAIPLAATAGLIALAEGLNGEVRYLRLLFSVGLGLAILNVVGVAIVTRLVAPALRIRSRLKFLPVLLLAAAIATVLSRITGIEPPLVGGVLIGAGFAFAVPARPRALVNLSQVGAVLALGIAGWVAHELIGPVDGFWASIAAETVTTLCLAGVGSALILMLPLGALPGRAILEWSPVGWFVATLAVATIASVILLGGMPAAFPMLASAVIVVGFAAVCVAIWAWSNYAREARA